MVVELANDLWQELKRYISVSDRADAADSVVNLLIENGHDAIDIKDAFKNDSDIRRVLVAYMEDHDLEEEEQDDYEDEY